MKGYLRVSVGSSVSPNNSMISYIQSLNRRMNFTRNTIFINQIVNFLAILVTFFSLSLAWLTVLFISIVCDCDIISIFKCMLWMCVCVCVIVSIYVIVISKDEIRICFCLFAFHFCFWNVYYLRQNVQTKMHWFFWSLTKQIVPKAAVLQKKMCCVVVVVALNSIKFTFFSHNYFCGYLHCMWLILLFFFFFFFWFPSIILRNILIVLHL